MTAAPATRAAVTRSRSTIAPSATANEDARLAHRGDGGRGRLSQRQQGERVRGERQRPGSRCSHADLRAERPQTSRDRVREHPDDGDGEQRELEVWKRRRVLDPALVHERVARDRARDDEGQEDAADVARRPEAADEHDADAHEHDAHRLSRPDRRTRGGRAQQDEHRRRPACDRVHEAQVRPPVRRREEEEVERLEAGRRREPGRGRRLDLPRCEGDRREDDHPDRERDHRRRPDVARAGEQDVPDRVERGGSRRPARTPSPTLGVVAVTRWAGAGRGTRPAG